MVVKRPSERREDIDQFRFGKAYTAGQAARLTGMTPALVRRWLTGSHAPKSSASTNGAHQGVGDAPAVSFVQVVEIAVVAQLRAGKRPASLDRLQRAHAFARERFGIPYPFASLSLRESGGQILHEFDEADPDGPALSFDIGDGWAIPGAVTHLLDRVDFSAVDRIAERWFPAGRETPIVLDPRRGAGRLTVFGTGVTVNTIYQRFLAGETIEHLATDYDLNAATIQEAVRYAERGELAVA